jgi:integrase
LLEKGVVGSFFVEYILSPPQFANITNWLSVSYHLFGTLLCQVFLAKQRRKEKKMPSRNKLYEPKIKRGTAWYIEWYIEIGGEIKRVRRRTTESGVELNTITDLKEREQVALAMLKQLRLRLKPPVAALDQTSFLEALQVAVELKHSNKEKTNKTFRETARWVDEYFHERGWQYIRCDAVELGHLQAYFDHLIIKKKVRNSTHNTRKNNLRSLLTELVQRGYLKENIVKQIPDRVEGDPLRRPLAERERLVVAEYIRKHDRPLWLAYLLLGHLAIRPGEIRDLRVGNVDFRRGLVVFPGEQSKNRRTSVVTIPEKLLPELQSFGLDNYPERYYVFGKAQGRHNCQFTPGSERIGANTLSNRFRQVIKHLYREGKIHDPRGLSLYSLKDTLAIRLLDAGVDVETAMRHFRHSSLEMFQRYVKRLGVVNEKIKGLELDL